MNVLSKMMLRAKHWQLFIFAYAIAAACLVASVVMLLAMLLLHQTQLEIFVSILNVGVWLMCAVVVSVVTIFLWLLAIGCKTGEKIPKEYRGKKGLFVFSVLFPIVFTILEFIGYMLVRNIILHGIGQWSVDSDMTIYTSVGSGAVWLIYVFCTIISAMCWIYASYYVAKTYKSAELNRSVQFEDYAADFFLFLFSFIGLWVLQPKINIMADEME